MELIKKLYNKNNDLIKVTFAICLTIFFDDIIKKY